MRHLSLSLLEKSTGDLRSQRYILLQTNFSWTVSIHVQKTRSDWQKQLKALFQYFFLRVPLSKFGFLLDICRFLVIYIYMHFSMFNKKSSTLQQHQSSLNSSLRQTTTTTTQEMIPYSHRIHVSIMYGYMICISYIYLLIYQKKQQFMQVNIACRSYGYIDPSVSKSDEIFEVGTFHFNIFGQNIFHLPRFWGPHDFWEFLRRWKKWMNTPPKFNIAPKNRESQKETHLPTIHFQGLS